MPGAKHAVLSVKDSDGWNLWGERYVARQPRARTQVIIENNPGADVAKRKIIETIRAAGNEGTVLFNVGHGQGGKPTLTNRQGSVELAPTGAMTIVGENLKGFVDVFYDDTRRGDKNTTQLEDDLKFSPNSQRLINWGVYQEIGRELRKNHIRKVIFLSCNVGNASEFLKKIARDWGVVVQAYTGKIEIQTITDLSPTKQIIREHHVMFTQNNPPPYGLASDMIIHEEEIPSESSQIVLFGPPLPTPPHP